MATPLTQRPSHPFSQFLGNLLVQMRRNPVMAALGIMLLVLLFFLLLPGGQRASRPAKGTVTVSPVTAKEYGRVLKLLMACFRPGCQTRSDSQRAQSPCQA